jgi:antitoxin component YwqK of YwqJK toxin-antitoxin module
MLIRFALGTQNRILWVLALLGLLASCTSIDEKTQVIERRGVKYHLRKNSRGLNGIQQIQLPNGKKITSTYVDDMLNGVQIRFYPSGAKDSVLTFKHDKLHGVQFVGFPQK